ncbi:FimV domain-containing protein [Acinetobacter sp. NIPH 2699]|uniref:FimV domain-containing protein n=1 Tax=Acinetobacter sp. NIPH 2699 TaxID=2923433 RepID=UPI001F4B1FDF|nr:FimV domain-containing protein [Acinetobacter sp. NIPH 2699]MCH7335545.1 FimV domain-containing protein [Acinetobacter sp. NIPH 2699]
MSTIIIVLLVIVLVVAIVLKKRENTQNHAASKKSASKAAKKTATRTALAREELASAPPATTAISENLRQKLTQQIQSGNYQSAEAQINQALKQDNSQHELYLFLLDIHLAQKDDFAIDQLIKHVHALKLEDIAQAAEAKNQERIKNNQSFDSIDFNSHPTPSHVEEVEAQNKTADFDALVQASAKPTFDDIQSEYTAPVEQEKPVEAAAKVQPLDFDFSFEQKDTVKPTSDAQEQPALEFSSNLASAPTAEVIPSNDVKPELDFNISNLEALSSQNKINDDLVTEAPSLDFKIEQPQHHTEQQTTIEKAEFSFEITEPTTAIEPNLELADDQAPQTPSVELNDPLAQSFPDLQQLDEAQLNLELAEQYIELGAYASARELLQNHQFQLNQEQQQRSEKLLNKIAS